MTHQIDHIVEHLFNKKKLEDVSENELEEFVATHPYFAAGHFLLSKKIQTNYPERSIEQVATTALYFNNALWLQWLLDQDLTLNKTEVKVFEPKTPTELISDTHTDNAIDVGELQFSETGEKPEGELAIVQEVIPVEGEFSNTDGQTKFAGENPADFLTVTGSSNSLNEESIDTGLTEPLEMEVTDPAEEDNELHSGTVVEVEPDRGEIILNDNSGVRAENYMAEYQPPPTGEIINGDDILNESLPETGRLHDENNIDQLYPEPDDEYAPDGMTDDDSESREAAASIGKTLATAALIPTKAEIEKNDFTFEPYHTIDYFASQGIKLQQSDLSTDKFGKQLRSFTEWLRSMKRLPQATIETNMDEATQKSIQQVAEHSIEEKEIVTETMAEVWIKQGNKEKAIDTLHKLSLLNPSKRHYFAAKIEQLKVS